MFKTFKLSFKIDTAYAVNSFVYILKKLPILKNIIPNDLYSNSGLKTFVSVLGIFLTTIRLVFYRLLYFFMIFCVTCLLYNSSLEKTFLHVYVILALIGIIMNPKLLNVSTKKYFSIILFRMDAKEYMKMDFIQELILSFILNLFGFLVSSIFIDLPLLIVLGLCLFSSISRIIGEAISIRFYKKHNYLLTSKYGYTYSYMFFMLLILCLPIFGIEISNTLFLLFLFVMFILAIYSYFYIMSIKDYYYIYKKLNTDKLAMNEKNSVAYTRQAMVEIKDRDREINSDVLLGKKGYDLFNTIFFERHKEILLRSAKTFTLISFIIVILLIVLVLIFKDFAIGINNILLNQLGWFVILMYFINRGAIITQAMFYNCDHAMLTYNFYREPKVLLKLFEKRLMMVVKVNLMPAIVIAIGTLILLILSGGTVMINYIMIPLFILLLSIFFSVHYLVIYYLLQPFNKDLEMKKASYSLVSGLTYFISYTITDLKVSSFLFSMCGLIFTIMYIIISLILVYKFAPKTFKINN